MGDMLGGGFILALGGFFATLAAVDTANPYGPMGASRTRMVGFLAEPVFIVVFLTVSFVGTEEFIKLAGSDSEGTIITQVVPPYDRTDFPTVALYREYLLKYYPGTPPSFVSLEGFVDAMVLVEGLKRAGKDLTREKLIGAIESIHNHDMGLGPKLTLNYGPTDHKGFDDVYDTVIKAGKPVVFSDWSSVGK
jgi:ABC-type branched-subunit amino acid transport system substrate-binding protein